MFHDLRHAIRTLVKSPGFTAVALLTLALGIGANTAIFSVLNALVLRPLPYADGDELVQVVESINGHAAPVSYPDYLDWRRHNTVFTDSAAHAAFAATFTGKGDPERIGVGYVSAGFLRTYRVQPELGRDFLPSEENEGAPGVAILSHAFWRKYWGNDRGVLGQAVTLNQRQFTVVGVLPASFHPLHGSEVYVPIGQAVKAYYLVRGNHDSTFVMARRRHGVPLERVRADLDTITRRLEQTYPNTNTAVRARVTPLREVLVGGARRSTLLMFGAVGFVLVIACVNVANLVLARFAVRRKEMALRAVLGASRGRAVRQVMTECAALGLAGGALGLLAAKLSFQALAALVPAAAAAGGLTLDGRVLAFSVAVSLLTGVLFGAAPAIEAMRAGLMDRLNQTGRTSSGRSEKRLRGALVVSQVALAFLLLAGAGLLIRSMQQLLRANPGFDPEDVVAMKVALPERKSPPLTYGPSFYRSVLERVKAAPGVREAGVVRHLYLSGGDSSTFVLVDGRPTPPKGQEPGASYKVASPGFFRAMRIPLLRGRMFTEEDGAPPPVRVEPGGWALNPAITDWWAKQDFAVVISDTMARRFFPGEDPVGKRFRTGRPDSPSPRAVIVGVVGDTRQHSLEQQPGPIYYYSSFQMPDDNLWLVARGANAAALIPAIRSAVREVDKGALITNATTMERLVSGAVAGRRTNTLLLGAFAVVALVLASIGVYGVMSFLVAQRTREIGVRVALGARRRDVLKLVIGYGVKLTIAGLAIGLAAAAALTRLISSMLYAVTALDGLTLGATAAVLLACGLAASYVPARRAVRIDPAVTLRGD